MRDIGVITLLSVAATAAAPGPRTHAMPSAAQETAATFAACLAQNDQSPASWWIVANDRGGSISGAAQIERAYLVVVNDKGVRHELELRRQASLPMQGQRGNSCN